MNAAEHFPLVYDELRQLAAAKLVCQSPDLTLDATALVHEVWLKIDKAKFEASSPSHLVAVAAKAMRQVLVDRARGKHAIKRDGGHRVAMIEVEQPMVDEQILALHELLERLEHEKPDLAQIIELRFFGGLSAEHAAVAMDISKTTADRMWRFARAWLDVELSRE